MKLTQTTGQTLRRQKSKGRKASTFIKERIQLSLKPGKRRPQTQSLKKKKERKKEKAEKYYTNEGTNYKHRHPSK